MPASYPSGVKTFTSRNAGDVIQPAHTNDLQDEVSALEAGLLTTGLAHSVTPSADATYNLGTASQRWDTVYATEADTSLVLFMQVFS